MDNKEVITTRAQRLLNNIGPTSMTMDMVARACGISKRTLYETFPDKKTLIMECIGAEHTQRYQDACKIFEKAPNCFEALFDVYDMSRRYNNKHSQAIAEEIKRLYPDVIEHQREGERIFIGQLSNVLKKAQSEGLVLEIVDTGIASFMFTTLNRTLHKDTNIEAMGYDREKVFTAAFINFLRGIATAQGRQVIKASTEKYFHTEQK